MSVGQISLFLPFWAILGTPYLHGARDLARKEERFLLHITKGRSPQIFVFATLHARKNATYSDRHVTQFCLADLCPVA